MDRASLLVAALCTWVSAANAHDTWFQQLPTNTSQQIRLALGTGNRFPQQEFTVGAASLQQHGCRSGAGQPVPLQTVKDTPQAVILRAAISPADTSTCWAQQQPFEVEIAAELVPVYFRDINATQAIRDTWAEMQARGVKWKERYAKHARIELTGKRTTDMPAVTTGMGMDVVLESGLRAVRAGDKLVFQVLRDGQPLPGLPVELRSDVSPLGFWKKTDSHGRVSFQPPLAGHWILRGTDLRLSTSLPDTWESRFVTLAFEVR